MPLMRKDAEKMLAQVDGWTLSADGRKILKEYRFKNFVDAMRFASTIIMPIAEREQHHPDLSIGWGRVGVSLSTHAINGLSENDFILAAKIDDVGT